MVSFATQEGMVIEELNEYVHANIRQLGRLASVFRGAQAGLQSEEYREVCNTLIPLIAREIDQETDTIQAGEMQVDPASDDFQRYTGATQTGSLIANEQITAY
jgi:hypothetical protein